MLGSIGFVGVFALVALACSPGSAGPDGAPGGDGGGGADAGSGDDGGGDPDATAPLGKPMVYVGSGGNSIRVYEIDPATLALTSKGSTTTGAAPSFLAFDAQARWLVAVNEGADAVESFTIAPTTGALTRKDGASAEGEGPAHIALDRSGAFVLVANYNDGSAAVLPISAVGDFGAPTATVAPGANAHQIFTDAANARVYVPCLGSDHVAIYDFAAGALAARPPVGVAAGAGPRHMALHPNGSFAYLLNELDSTVTTFAVGVGGGLTAAGTVSTLPGNFGGGNSGAEIEVHPSGKFVYASNRGHDSIAVFTVGPDGALTPAGHTVTGGTTPRHFSLVLEGTALLVANQGTGTITGFRVNAITGQLTRVGNVLAEASNAQFVGSLRLPAP